MIFNSKKFNIVLGMTIALICVVVAFSTVSIENSSKQSVSIENAVADSGEKENTTESKTEETQKEIEESGLKKLTGSFDSANQALSYALSLLNLNNYNISFNQTVKAGAAGIDGVQKVKKSIYYVDGTYYVKNVADGSDVPAGYGENYTEYSKTQNSNITVRRGNSLITQTTGQYISTYALLPSDIPYNMTAILKLSNKSFKKDPDKDYYEIEVNLNSTCWKEYVSYMTASGGSAPSISSIKLTIKIDKTYGYFKSISATEKYSISRAGFNADATSMISMSFGYSNNHESAISEINNQLK